MKDRHNNPIILNREYMVPDAAGIGGKNYKKCTVVGFSGSFGVRIRERKIGNAKGMKESTVLPSLLVHPDRVPSLKRVPRRCRDCGDPVGPENNTARCQPCGLIFHNQMMEAI